jgi:UDP-2-acetamido-2-deoxy-ribo-hexuluronate aminotransferase
MNAFNDLAPQLARLRPAIQARIDRVLDHGQYIMGPEIAELENALANRIGVRHCLSMASGTTALEIALRCLDIGPGDEVITTPFTWIATANAIAITGATPVFVDIRADGSYLIDPERIAQALSPRTRAILPVGLFGQPPETDVIAAAAPGVPIIEDAAQSFGSTRHGHSSCALTRIGCTSFFPSKPLGCFGDGGALFTDDDDLAERARAIRSHGGVRRHHHTVIGCNGRMDTIQAAILLAKLATFDEEIALRRAAATRYDALLDGLVGLPTLRSGNTSVHAQYTVDCGMQRDACAQRLATAGIPSAIYYPTPVHQQPAFAGHCRCAGSLASTEAACRSVLSLPFHPWLTVDEQERTRDVLHG